MKKTPILLFIFSFFLNYSIIYSQSVTFFKKNPIIGEEKYYSFLIKQNIEITAIQNDIPAVKIVQSSINVENKKIKILDAVNDKINKIEVFFEKLEETNKDGNVESTKVDPVSGKTYIIKNNEGKMEIAYSDGKIPSDEEIKYITDNEKEFDQENYLGNMSVKLGDRVPVLETVIKNQFLNILNADKNSNEISVYFREIRDFDNFKCGFFEIKINAKAPVLDTLEMDINLIGEIVIAVDTSTPIFLKLDGPVTLNGTVTNEGKTMIMKGNGSINYDLKIKNLK